MEIYMENIHMVHIRVYILIIIYIDKKSQKHLAGLCTL